MKKEKIIFSCNDYVIMKLEDGILSYDCNHCGRSYLEEKNIKKHVIEHKRSRKFKKIEWNKNTATYANGSEAKIIGIAQITIGTTHWDSCRSKRDDKPWMACTNMIGVKRNLGNFKTEKEAIKIIEKAYKYWQKLLIEE